MPKDLIPRNLFEGFNEQLFTKMCFGDFFGLEERKDDAPHFKEVDSDTYELRYPVEHYKSYITNTKTFYEEKNGFKLVKVDVEYSDKGFKGYERFHISIPEDANPDTITATKSEDHCIIIRMNKK